MRDIRIDTLRFIGLSMIIFAHVNPPGILFQLRNFDVPLMVLVAGMSFGISYKIRESYTSYCIKRFKRLVAPVWLFLTVYFIATFLYNPSHPDLSASKLLTSYGLVSGIGYVWIIRVFVMVALVSPFIYQIHKKVKSDAAYFSYIGLLFIVFEIIRYITIPYADQIVFKLIFLVSHYIIPYSLIFALGLRMLNLQSKNLQVLALVNLTIFTFIAIALYVINGEIIPTQQYKYPPSYYYFSYAIFVASVLCLLASKINTLVTHFKLNYLVYFIAKNSIWVYLWHIPFVKFLSVDNFLIKYVLVYPRIQLRSATLSNIKKLKPSPQI
ncbi:acyltransferase, partial [Vibrio zhugei]|nr:acyltransferase [Vibrio zhugei]